ILGVLAAPSGLEARELRLDVPLRQAGDGRRGDVGVAFARRAVARLAGLEQLCAPLHPRRGRLAGGDRERERRRGYERLHGLGLSGIDSSMSMIGMSSRTGYSTDPSFLTSPSSRGVVTACPP